MKSTPEEIRQRFDQDVERFSNIQTGQSATMDAPLVLDLIAEAARAVTPEARALLDVGCGAGNYTLRLLQSLPGIQQTTLIDLSQRMLDRAMARVAASPRGGQRAMTAMRGDIRSVSLAPQSFDVITAAAVLHHLREEDEWESVFTKLYQALRPGGSIWISDLIAHRHPAIQASMQQRYGEYLTSLKNEKYRDEVLAYIEREDSPRPLEWQLDLLKRIGFRSIEVLHKHLCFAAFGAMR